jgi:hypothetical protein
MVTGKSLVLVQKSLFSSSPSDRLSTPSSTIQFPVVTPIGIHSNDDDDDDDDDDNEVVVSGHRQLCKQDCEWEVYIWAGKKFSMLILLLLLLLLCCPASEEAVEAAAGHKDSAVWIYWPS